LCQAREVTANFPRSLVGVCHSSWVWEIEFDRGQLLVGSLSNDWLLVTQAR